MPYFIPKMSQPLFGLLLTLGLVAAAGNAHAKKESVKDELTVSGRFSLPKAKPSLHEALEVKSDMSTEQDIRELSAKTLKLKPEELDEMVLKAFRKSLANYRYVTHYYEDPNAEEGAVTENEATAVTQSEDAAGLTPITLKIDSVEFEENEDGIVSTVSLDIDSPKACLKAETKARFLALKIEDTEKDKKIFSFVAITALNVVAVSQGSYANAYNNDVISLNGVFLNGQLSESEKLNKINTYGEKTAFGESYPPKRGKKMAKRHALKNALRLNFARYIALIDQSCS